MSWSDFDSVISVLCHITYTYYHFTHHTLHTAVLLLVHYYTHPQTSSVMQTQSILNLCIPLYIFDCTFLSTLQTLVHVLTDTVLFLGCLRWRCPSVNNFRLMIKLKHNLDCGYLLHVWGYCLLLIFQN